jgi:hypothetical protein
MARTTDRGFAANLAWGVSRLAPTDTSGTAAPAPDRARQTTAQPSPRSQPRQTRTADQTCRSGQRRIHRGLCSRPPTLRIDTLCPEIKSLPCIVSGRPSADDHSTVPEVTKPAYTFQAGVGSICFPSSTHRSMTHQPISKTSGTAPEAVWRRNTQGLRFQVPFTNTSPFS